MGCCSSSVAAGDGQPPNHPYDPTSGNNGPESRRNITEASPRASPQASRASVHPKKTSAGRPNRPLFPIDPHRFSRLPDPTTTPTSTNTQNPSSTTWTPAKLQMERHSWWDTREETSSNPQIWAAYRSMVEYLQIGEVEEAQALLDAAGCTCPSGKLWRGVFDERGVEYNLEDDHRQIHDWLVFPPTGLAPEKPEGQNEGWNEASSEGRIKGKGKVVESEIKMKSLKKYRVRCRFRDPDKDPDLMISMVEGETIGSLMEKVGEITQYDPARLKVSFLGKIYNHNNTLEMNPSSPRAWKEDSTLGIIVRPES